jgi:hypothetical protein
MGAGVRIPSLISGPIGILRKEFEEVVMARFSVRLILAELLLCSGLAFAQGDFAHFVYGAGWQTTFTLVNLSTADPADVSLYFYNSDGTSQQADVKDVGKVTPYTFTIPAGGSKTVALVGDPAAAAQTDGSAQLVVVGGSATVRGQGSFRRHLNGQPDFEAVVPLTSYGSECILPFPKPNPLVLLPFDNTTGEYTTALAFANTSTDTQMLQLEYDDESNQKIVSKTLTLPPNNHIAFVTTKAGDASDPILAGKKGVLRIQATTKFFAVLGLLFNSTGPYTAILPISQ